MCRLVLGPFLNSQRSVYRRMKGINVAHVGFLALVSIQFGFPQRQDPAQIVAEADRLGMLGNWDKARPLFGEAEGVYAASGDAANELYCKLGQLYSDLQRKSYLDTAQYLDSVLADLKVQANNRLKLRALALKG